MTQSSALLLLLVFTNYQFSGHLHNKKTLCLKIFPWFQLMFPCMLLTVLLFNLFLLWNFMQHTQYSTSNYWSYYFYWWVYIYVDSIFYDTLECIVCRSLSLRGNFQPVMWVHWRLKMKRRHSMKMTSLNLWLFFYLFINRSLDEPISIWCVNWIDQYILVFV